jgi:tetratricopeptide (TPR) repeat protein
VNKKKGNINYGQKRVFVLVTFFILSFSISAQTQKQLVKEGDKLNGLGDYYGASKWYKKALNIDSTYLDIVFKYAESLRNYNDYAKAEWYYFSIYKKDRGRVYPMAPFWYSTMLKYNGKYQDAKKFFKRSKRSFTKDRKGYHYLKVMQEIKSCQAAILIMRDTLQTDIKNMGDSINTYSSELGATLLNDSTIIYSSLRDEKMKSNNVVTDTSLYLVRLFQGSKNGEIWQSDKKLEEKINESNFHIANGCLNSEGNTFYYNKCTRDYNCKIFAIEYINSEWQTPYEVENINIEGYTTSQPFITKIKDKDVLLFSSNRPGGIGMKDIWFSRKGNDGKFQAPANLGKNVNTIEDEITPFYNTEDTSIYYSSNWTEGLGGFDIFKSQSDLITFSKPKNLGYPINSSVNDFYYSIKNKTALLTSNRIGSFTKKGETCCNDIYYYEIPDTIEPLYTTLEELNRYLPVRLYFHNDHPNPRTRDTLTEMNYMSTYKSYTRRYNEYKKAYAKGLKNEDKDDAIADIGDLFSDYIDKGASDLALFTPLLIKELEDGKTITLTIKGFASPLSKSDYNVNLTLRRVSSLINYLSEYEEGKVLPYINGTAENGGKLIFIKVPFGEYQSATISDDIKDQRNSIYSPGAALERKIEIIAIQADDTNQVALDGSEREKLPLLTFKDSIIQLEVGQTEKQLKIINNGEAPLKIFSATFSCEGFTIDLPGLEIPLMEPLELKLTYNPKEQVPKTCTVEFLTNTIPNKIRMEIRIE